MGRALAPPTRRLAFVMLGAAGLSSGCAARMGTAQAPSGVASHELSGRMGFHADFHVRRRDPPPRHSLVPTGDAPLPGIRICAFQQRGAHDLAHGGHLKNDRKLACTSTDADGHYALKLPRDLCRSDRGGSVRCDPRIYLATDMCSVEGDRAQVCVGSNVVPEGRVHDVGWKKLGHDRKLMWSETYRIDLEARTSNLVQWNLSCPGQDGIGRSSMACERVGRGGYFDRRNSNTGYNEEAVHALWAGSMLVRRFGDLVPRRGTTRGPGGSYCGAKGTPGWKAKECSDAIRIVLTRMRRLGDEDKICKGKRTDDHVTARNAVCIGSPKNPWIVVHELGHAVHLRWMNYKGKLNTRADGRAMQEANKTQTSEGWADFVAAAVLHERDDLAPTFNGRDLARTSRSGCSGGRRSIAELSVSQVFWDLWDPTHPSDPNDDHQVELSTLLEVWSMFTGEDGVSSRDRTKGECDPHGRNLFDYRHYWLRHPDRPADLLPLMREHCVEWHEPKTTCGSTPSRSKSGRRSRGNR